MREDGARRLARIADGVRGLALRKTHYCQLVECFGCVRMIWAARLLVNGKCPLVGLLRIIVAPRVLEHLSLAQQHGGDETVIWAEIFRGDLERTPELGVRLGVTTLRIIGNAELADHFGSIRI